MIISRLENGKRGANQKCFSRIPRQYKCKSSLSNCLTEYMERFERFAKLITVKKIGDSR